MNAILKEAKDLNSWIIKKRRQLHQVPELAFQEKKTHKIISQTLKSLEVKVESPIAKTGLVAQLGDGSSPCVGLRADIDGLPIEEQTKISFKSKIKGQMHACGHDCHTAMLLGAVKLLKKYESKIKGTIKFIFQPAEEGAGGANLMIEQGVLENEPKIESIIGLHLWPYIQSGIIASKSGVLMAGAGFFDINILGKGGHAAIPELANNPIVLSAKFIENLQKLIADNQNPSEPAILSITHIKSNESYNIIPENVKIKGTFRAFSNKKLQQIKQILEDYCLQFSKLNDCQVKISYPYSLYPPTINDALIWSELQTKLKKVIGKEKIHEAKISMTAEDFSSYGYHIPSCFIFLGIGNKKKNCCYSLHHPKFKVDESVLYLGSAIHCLFALEQLTKNKLLY